MTVRAIVLNVPKRHACERAAFAKYRRLRHKVRVRVQATAGEMVASAMRGSPSIGGSIGARGGDVRKIVAFGLKCSVIHNTDKIHHFGVLCGLLNEGLIKPGAQNSMGGRRRATGGQ